MEPIPLGLLFLGYMLVYAATANQGSFATQPWRGVFEDAYSTQATTPLSAESIAAADAALAGGKGIVQPGTAGSTSSLTPNPPAGVTLKQSRPRGKSSPATTSGTGSFGSSSGL